MSFSRSPELHGEIPLRASVVRTVRPRISATEEPAGRMAGQSRTSILVCEKGWAARRNRRGERGTAPSGTITRDNSNQAEPDPHRVRLHPRIPRVLRDVPASCDSPAIAFRDVHCQSDTQRQRRDFRERWHVLKQYKCDPWQEIETFEHKLRRAAGNDVRRYQDTDVRHRTVCTDPPYGSVEQGGLGRIQLPSFFGGRRLTIPPSRLEAIATTSAAGTLTRIAEYSSYWALTTLVRIGDAKVVDEGFDRPSLARMDTPTVDGLIERYLDSLRFAVADIATADRSGAPRIWAPYAGRRSARDRALSRLCVKSSRQARERLRRVASRGISIRAQVELSA